MLPIFKKRGLIVSCQALPGEPLFGDGIMAKMALAAEQAGAIGIRTNGVKDIADIKKSVSIPVIGLIKRDIPGSEVYITPTLKEVNEIMDAGADIVALDVTDRENRLQTAKQLIDHIHTMGKFVMADISTFDEGMQAEKLGADLVSTTLSGYTTYSRQQEGPDLELVKVLHASLQVPLVAEGRIWSPEEAVQALESGANFVVVGSAISRPQLITKRYVERMSHWLDLRL
jgi:N-acylglucosamine-6-phosphate 2-epimerase